MRPTIAFLLWIPVLLAQKQPFTVDTSHLSFEIPSAPAGNHLARLRVDGVDSPIINPAASPPAFLNRRIQIT